MDDFSFNGFGNNTQNKYNMSTHAFYTESYRNKRAKRNNYLIQLILVALISSILGGGVVFAAFQFVAPAIQPSVQGYFDNMMPKQANNTSAGDNSTVYKKIEIEKTDSPVTWIAQKVSPSVVGIKVTSRVQEFFFGEREQRSEGSGIIYSSDGYIVTNFHVIQSALDYTGTRLNRNAKIEVYLPNQLDKPYEAEVRGTDEVTDLAVIKINATGLKPAEFGNSDELEVGELAVAIGNPGGLELMGSVTVGVISGLNRTIQAVDKNLKLIQTDAAINPGNSGGALVNSQGLVIGINTLKFANLGYEGLGFAIPSNEVKKVADYLIENKYVPGRPFLGIKADIYYDEETAIYRNLPAGVRVVEVIESTGAHKAGIKAGDIITKFDGQPVKSLTELNELKDKHKPGDKVKVEVYRNGSTITLEVTLSEQNPANY